LSTPLLQEYLRRNPRTPATISYVHDASLGEKAMRVLTADMQVIGKDDVIPKVQAQQSEIALVIVGGTYWLGFPDKHLVLWRFDGPDGLLRWNQRHFHSGDAAITTLSLGVAPDQRYQQTETISRTTPRRTCAHRRQGQQIQAFPRMSHCSRSIRG